MFGFGKKTTTPTFGERLYVSVVSAMLARGEELIGSRLPTPPEELRGIVRQTMMESELEPREELLAEVTHWSMKLLLEGTLINMLVARATGGAGLQLSDAEVARAAEIVRRPFDPLAELKKRGLAG